MTISPRKALPTAELYCSPLMNDKLAALIADGSTDALVRLGKLHAVMLGLALDSETVTSLSVSLARPQQVILESTETPYTYNCELRDSGLRISKISRAEPFGTSRKIRVAYQGEPSPKRVPKVKKSKPAPILRPVGYDDRTNTWLDAAELAPALTRKYIRNGIQTTVKAELRAAIVDGLSMNYKYWYEMNCWLGMKGVVVFEPQGATYANVRFFPDISVFTLSDVLTKKRGASAVSELMTFAGPGASLALDGSRVATFKLHLDPVV